MLDLAVFLPAVGAVGGQLWRRRARGYVGAVPLLLFLALAVRTLGRLRHPKAPDSPAALLRDEPVAA